MGITIEKKLAKGGFYGNRAELERLVNLHPVGNESIDCFAVINPDPMIHIFWSVEGQKMAARIRNYSARVVTAKEGKDKFSLPPEDTNKSRNRCERHGQVLMQMPIEAHASKVALNQLKVLNMMTNDHDEIVQNLESLYKSKGGGNQDDPDDTSGISRPVFFDDTGKSQTSRQNRRGQQEDKTQKQRRNEHQANVNALREQRKREGEEQQAALFKTLQHAKIAKNAPRIYDSETNQTALGYREQDNNLLDE